MCVCKDLSQKRHKEKLKMLKQEKCCIYLLTLLTDACEDRKKGDQRDMKEVRREGDKRSLKSSEKGAERLK